MGVFGRIRRLIRSNVNDAVRKAEDPEKMLNQLILDMNKQLVEAKRNVATAISEEKRLQRQVESQHQSAEQWEQRAMTALRAGKEDLAREALQRKKRESDYATQLQEQYDKQHEAVESLKSSLRDLQGRIEEAQRKKNVLVARAKRAEAQKKIQEIITGLGNTSAFDAFDEMSKRVEQLEIENESMAELESTPADRSLEDQIDALENPGGDDAMLEDLRKKMDQGPADPDVDASLAELKKKLRADE
ncbi:MAG TPA: PspA/IM30 family protein [Alkalispirochaeta sp.]|nr:PspA/IM30 family protein [Alkalispirochaeta sp.]